MFLVIHSLGHFAPLTKSFILFIIGQPFTIIVNHILSSIYGNLKYQFIRYLCKEICGLILVYSR